MKERRLSTVSIGLAAFLARVNDEIVSEWRARMTGLAHAHAPSPAALAGDMPAVLTQVADLADQIASRQPAEAYFETARGHARQRLSEELDVTAVVLELSALRASIWTVWQRHHGAPAMNELQPIDLAIDATIAASVARFQDVRHLALERALGKLESLLAASPVGIAFLDRDLRYLRINDALAALNGRPAAEHVGRSITEILPEHAPVIAPMLRDVLDRGTSLLDVEMTLPPARGATDEHVVLANFFPVRSRTGGVIGVGGVVLDVTDRRRTEAALRREQLRVQSILEHTPASIWVKDLDGHIVLANHRLADALGHPYERIIGATSDELLPLDAAAQHEEHDQVVAREQRAIEVEEVVPSADGDKIFLSIKFPIPGEPPMVGGIATDITQRKHMENELRDALRARDNVLAVVSHDLRNPLGAIELSATVLAGQAAGDARARRHLEVIQRSCNRMKHLIDDLLDMASIAAGRLAVEMRTESAADVTREAVELHRPLAEERGITLASSCAVGDVSIACDRDRIMQVFANLVGNALKFCRAGDTVGIDCRLVDDSVCYTVSDSGPGIPAEQRARLFDPYWSGPGTKGGAGLGLYIARGIVERHGGRLTVESVVGEGTRFSFTVPAA